MKEINKFINIGEVVNIKLKNKYFIILLNIFFLGGRSVIYGILSFVPFFLYSYILAYFYRKIQYIDYIKKGIHYLEENTIISHII